MHMLQSIDLFSGIGGMSLALHGFCTPRVYCDIEDTSRTTLANLIRRGKLPKAPIEQDVRTMQPPLADIVLAGFPCLGFSPLGKRGGLENEQSHLVYDVIRITRESRARIVFLENHVNLVGPRFQKDFEEIVKGFRDIGFTTIRYISMHGHDVGCPQSRNRVYILLTKPDPPPLPHHAHKHIPFSWKHIPCPMSTCVCPAHRVKLLGNSVIPDLTRLAFQALWTVGTTKSRTFESQIRLPVLKRSHQYHLGDVTPLGILKYVRPIESLAASVPELVIDPALYTAPPAVRKNVSSPLVTLPVHRKGFPTLSTNQTSGCHILTKRSSRHLVTMLRSVSYTHLRAHET